MKRRNAFDVAPTMMHTRPPSSRKPDPTLPCTGMVRTRWRKAHYSSTDTLRTQVDPVWWATFASRFAEEDFSDDDWKFINEMDSDTEDESNGPIPGTSTVGNVGAGGVIDS